MLSIIQAAGWPIYPLILFSIVALALIVERCISLQRRNIVPAQLLTDTITLLRNNKITASFLENLASSSLLGSVFSQILTAKVNSPEISNAEIQDIAESAGKLAIAKMEKFLNTLATIASTAPLMGLLGTVIGMIEIFAAQGSAMAMGNPEQLAYGISIALYNTAFGLIIAIPALICWRYFRGLTNQYVLEMETQTNQLLHHILSRN